MNAGPDRLATTAGRRFGSFRLGALHLALPMQALREVVPRTELVALPCSAPGLAGGIVLRGVVVPVLDLRALLAPAAPAADSPCVVIMVHAGRIIGLLADGVTGVFADTGSTAAEALAADHSALLFSGCVRSSDGTVVSVLAPDAIAQLPGLPMVDDPAPARELLDTSVADEAAVAAPTALPMMFVRSARVTFALDAMAVHATLSDLQIDADTPLAIGDCRGVIDYAGARVPAVDLLALCGFGRLDPAAAAQAFLVRFAQGLLALLVERVVDICPIERAAVLPLPAFARRSRFFAGVMPGRGGAQESPCFVLDGAALQDDANLVALASTVKAHEEDDVAMRASTSLLTYDLGVETASPLEQVQEILACAGIEPVFGPGDALRGVLVSRGRSIPVLCLQQLTTGRPLAPTASGSVLVVESAGELMGFMVAGLKAIEPSRWQPAVGQLGRSLAGSSGDDSACKRLAMLGEGAGERMVPVLDLKELAESIRRRAA